MTRNRSTSRRRGWWALLLLLALGGAPGAQAQPTSQPEPAASPQGGDLGPSDSTVASAPVTSAPAASAPAAPASNWPWVLGVLGGIALGVLGARMWARRSAPAAGPAPTPVVAPTSGPGSERKKPAENVVVRPPVVQSLRKVQSSEPGSALPKPYPRPSATGGKPKQHNPKKHSPSRQSPPWPTNVPFRSAAMNPTQPPVPPAPDDQPLETGQTIEWAAPTSTPPAIQELIDAGASEHPTTPPEAPASEVAAAAGAPVAATGPVHYYAPAPDVPSIEHRKLSPNPLPQMPLLVTLPHAEATTAQFSFSPQADQSRIIGNGVRELKEFFAFELPPTEQFTSIKNLTAGQLEKRDDAWHVVQKAEIALS